MRASRLLIAIFVFCAAAAAMQRSASAAILTFEANLDGLQETPPNASPGFGFASMTLNTVTNQFDLTGTFSGLIGTTTDGHVHGPAAPGTPASVMFPITFTPGVSAGAMSFSGIITAGQATNIINELGYINIHSTVFPGGEIRGQILATPEPSSALIIALVALPMAARRRRAM